MARRPKNSKRPFNIVLTNDDGAHTKGIWTLAQALLETGNVTVVAPDREQSGVGMAISFNAPVRITESLPRIGGVKTFLVEGTPADAVLLAVQGHAPSPVDLVISGINEGANVGMNVLVSGTVGAAFQAHCWDIPAIAISVAGTEKFIFDGAAKVAQVLAHMFRDGTLSGPMLLNVNVPSIAPDEIQGVRITRLGRGRYKETLEKANAAKPNYYWVARGKADWQAEEGTDVWAIRNKFVSITPLHIDLTSDVVAPMLSEFAPAIYQAFKG